MTRLLVGAALAVSFLSAQTAIRGFPETDAAKIRDWEKRANAVPKPDSVRDFVRRMAAEPHHAGSPESHEVAKYIQEKLRGWGYDATIEEFEALLPVPKARRLELTAPTKFTAKLKEPEISQDSDSGDANQLPTYNAYAASGNVTAPLVYVNYGIPSDYEYLKQQGIDVKGKIVIARYGGSWRGVKPKVAAEHGAIACIIYSDPRDDGYFAGDAYPRGAFRPKDGVQRGSVMDMAVYPGDPLSPGWASEKGSRRLTREESRTLQKIPVLPISYADATPLLEALEGPVAPEHWRGALPLTYHIGPGPATVHLELEIDWAISPLYNVIARIPGSRFPDEWVIYGNHHDAWVNGANDPVSGAAALLETARSLSELQKQGWKPARTVVIAFWDAEEFGLVGSTEWVEKHAKELDAKVVAYINSDSNSRGKFNAGGSHTLEQFMAEVARDSVDPVKNESLLSLREEQTEEKQKETAQSKKAESSDPMKAFHISALGSGSDYTAFIHHLGIASLNLGFSDGNTRGIYHSIYDSVYWYERFGDPDYLYGPALSRVMNMVLLRLADAPLLPFEFERLSKTLGDYADQLAKSPDMKDQLKLHPVQQEIAHLGKVSRSVEEAYQKAVRKADSASSDALARINARLYRTERAMLSTAGLPGRDWFKHQFYAPGLYTGYGVKTLPGVREAAEAKQWEQANAQAAILAATIRRLADELEATRRDLERL